MMYAVMRTKTEVYVKEVEDVAAARLYALQTGEHYVSATPKQASAERLAAKQQAHYHPPQ